MGIDLRAVIGVLRLILEVNKPALSGLPLAFAEINFLHFALILFLFCSALLIGVSYWKPMVLPSSAGQVIYVRGAGELSNKINLRASAFLVAVILVIWYAFS